MADDNITITFNCGKCRTQLSWPDDACDSTEICCKQCGERAGTYGELREKGTEAARKEVESMLQKAFENWR
ncbi:MAG: hypothetical protein HY916_11905 [Desulfovibrio sp.]|jgi:hypothetical protein|nr:hypothetical protein [Desulfovibrio sp.]